MTMTTFAPSPDATRADLLEARARLLMARRSALGVHWNTRERRAEMAAAIERAIDEWLEVRA
jgi:hypothetical protein